MRKTGIPDVDADVYAWRSEESSPGAQIDLLIERKDGVINLCEMKYADGKYASVFQNVITGAQLFSK